MGDITGTVSSIDWKQRKQHWSGKWHSDLINCLKLNSKRDQLLSGSEDFFVKLVSVKDRQLLFQYQLNHFVLRMGLFVTLQYAAQHLLRHKITLETIVIQLRRTENNGFKELVKTLQAWIQDST